MLGILLGNPHTLEALRPPSARGNQIERDIEHELQMLGLQPIAGGSDLQSEPDFEWIDRRNRFLNLRILLDAVRLSASLHHPAVNAGLVREVWRTVRKEPDPMICAALKRHVVAPMMKYLFHPTPDQWHRVAQGYRMTYHRARWHHRVQREVP